MDTPLFHGDLVESRRLLYTPSPFAKTSLLHLQEIGELKARQPHTSTRENLSSYLFFIVLSGSGILEYSGNTYPLGSGDCVFLDCRRGYSHRSSADLWQLRWVHFYGPLMSNIYEKYIERGGQPVFHLDTYGPLEELLIQLQAVASSDDYIRDMRINEKLTSLMTLIMEHSWHPEHRHISAKRQNLQRVKDYLDLHYSEKISLDRLAELFFINKFYLTRIFKEQFGVSIHTYLLQTRITHAKQLLRFTDQTIESIGLECGLGDANYFNRSFKKLEGVTPGKFRKMWRV